MENSRSKKKASAAKQALSAFQDKSKPNQEQDPERYALDTASQKSKQGAEQIIKVARKLSDQPDDPISLPSPPRSPSARVAHSRQTEHRPKTRDAPEVVYHKSRHDIKMGDAGLKDKSAVAERQETSPSPNPAMQEHIRQKQVSHFKERRDKIKTEYSYVPLPASDLSEAGIPVSDDTHIEPARQSAVHKIHTKEKGQRQRQKEILEALPALQGTSQVQSQKSGKLPDEYNAISDNSVNLPLSDNTLSGSPGKQTASPEHKSAQDTGNPDTGSKKLKTNDRQTGTLKTRGKSELKQHFGSFKEDTEKGLKSAQNHENGAIPGTRSTHTSHYAGQTGQSTAKAQARIAAKSGAGAAGHTATRSAAGGATLVLEMVKKGKDKLQEIAERNDRSNNDDDSTQKLGCFGTVACALFIPCFLVFFVIFGKSSFSSGSNRNLSAEVLAFMPVIQETCQKYEIPEYAYLVAAIMMQESGGRANACNGDVMQAAESQGWPAGTYIEPEQSIEYGVIHFKECLTLSGMPPPNDLPGISLALQSYNFGTGYISWALNNHGGYTKENAAEFAGIQAQKLGWSSYGDVHYVEHVLRYYSISSGSGDLVDVATAQLGNSGEIYWSWYGFSGRVEWCACFVSWCADQCGYIDAEIIPKFAGCSYGVAWFKNRNQWQDKDYIPSPGNIMFFNWYEQGVGQDSSADHVGIVEKVENGRIFTLEGNSNDLCRRNSYPIGHFEIYGYGMLCI